MNYRFTSAALGELKEALLDYESREKGLGRRFLSQIDAAIARILMAPEAWRRLSVRTRRCQLHRFPFGLLYQIRREEILVVSVMDLRRDPARWQKYL